MTISPRRRGLGQRSRTATGAPSAVPRTPARLAGWVRREAVLALAGEGGTGLAARTARDRRRFGAHGRRPRASGGGADDRPRGAQVWPSNRLVTEPSLTTSLIP